MIYPLSHYNTLKTLIVLRPCCVVLLS
jgi:hypothetical protein